jgi:hypothetical protein
MINTGYTPAYRWTASRAAPAGHGAGKGMKKEERRMKKGRTTADDNSDCKEHPGSGTIPAASALARRPG